MEPDVHQNENFEVCEAMRMTSVHVNRRAALEDLGFEFIAECAEWERWYTELQMAVTKDGETHPLPLNSGADFLLLNWCTLFFLFPHI